MDGQSGITTPKTQCVTYEEARALSDESFYDLSGLAYQRLGQYDKALEIYRNHYAETGDRFAKAHIEAIEAGEGIPALVR